MGAREGTRYHVSVQWFDRIQDSWKAWLCIRASAWAEAEQASVQILQFVGCSRTCLFSLTVYPLNVSCNGGSNAGPGLMRNVNCGIRWCQCVMRAGVEPGNARISQWPWDAQMRGARQNEREEKGLSIMTSNH